MLDLPVVLAITGPTAVGKTSLIEELASTRDISVISIDSRQIYQEIDIGSAKPSRQEMETVPHYLVDEIKLETTISAGQYQKRVLEATDHVLSQERLPVWIGGSTLYFHSLLFGIADIPSIDPEIRKRISEEYSENPEKSLERLRKVDPQLAINLDASKSHRIIRGLEVFDATKKALSDFHTESTAPTYPFEIRTIVLKREREELYDRINFRVEKMIESGLIDEVKSIVSRHSNPSELPGLNSIGYTEVLGYLNKEIDLEEMTRLIKRNSRRYAKRQITWFKKYESISTTIDLSTSTQDEVSSRILSIVDGLDY